MTYGVFMLILIVLLVGTLVLSIADDKYDVVDRFSDWLYDTVVKIQKRA